MNASEARAIRLTLWRCICGLGSIESEKRNHGWNNQPQQALYQKKYETPEAKALDPGLHLSRHALELKKILAFAVCCGRELKSERTKMYIAQHSIANGGNPRKPNTGISKILMLPK